MKNSFSKPSRKILILAISAAIVITLLLVNKFWGKGGDLKSLQNISFDTSVTDTNALALMDENKDGTPDWKEMLLTSPDTATSSENSEPKTLSEGVARKLLANAVYLSNNGEKEISEEDTNNLVNSLVGELQSSMEYKQYVSANLSVKSNPTVDEIRDYGTKLAKLQLSMIIEMNQRIGAIQGDVGVLGKIYAKQADNLFAMTVPEGIAETHLRAVNNFSRAATAFEAFANEKNDPIKLPFAIQLYKGATADQAVALSGIAEFFKESGIIFTSNELGGYWNAF